MLVAFCWSAMFSASTSDNGRVISDSRLDEAGLFVCADAGPGDRKASDSKAPAIKTRGKYFRFTSKFSLFIRGQCSVVTVVAAGASFHMRNPAPSGVL